MTIRKTVTVTANGEEYLVKELTIKEIISFIDSGGKVPDKADGGGKAMTDDLFGQIDELMALSVPGLNIKKLTGSEDPPEDGWAPSEVKKLYDAFREVNTIFFEVAQRLGLNNLIGEMEKAVAKDFSALFATSLRQGIAKP